MLAPRPVPVRVSLQSEVRVGVRSPRLLHLQRQVLVVEFALVLLRGAHHVNGKQLLALFAVVAVEEDLDQVVHRCFLGYVQTFVLGLEKFKKKKRKQSATFFTEIIVALAVNVFSKNSPLT